MWRLFVVAVVIAATSLAALPVRADAHSAEDLACYHCRHFVHRVAFRGEKPAAACKLGDGPLLDGCNLLLRGHPRVVRAALSLRARRKSSPPAAAVAADPDELRGTVYDMCAAAKLCPLDPLTGATDAARPVSAPAPDAAGWNLRVMPRSALRLGGSSAGVRVAVIEQLPSTMAPPLNESAFDYNENFKLYWTTHWRVHVKAQVTEGIVPGRTSIVRVGGSGGLGVPVRVAQPGAGIRFAAVGDPCFSGAFVNCRWGRQWGVLERVTSFLNKQAAHQELDAWVLLGDNFYELGPTGGVLSMQFFKRLTPAALGVPLIALHGNHEVTQFGSRATIGIGFSPFLNTHVQAFPVDSVYAAGVADSAPPFALNTSDPRALAPQENFVAFYTVGDVAFLSFSAAYEATSVAPFFARACRWLAGLKRSGNAAVRYVVVLNHWSNTTHSFAQAGMSAGAQRDALAAMPGCADYAAAMISIEGHEHDNRVVRPGIGFRVGGFGMDSSSATADFGFNVFDTKSEPNRMLVWYFAIASARNWTDTGDAAWDALSSCIDANGGTHACVHLGTLWANITGLQV